MHKQDVANRLYLPLFYTSLPRSLVASMVCTECIKDKFNFGCWFGFRLEPILLMTRPAQKNVAHFKSGQK